jgi:hypothetical protein
MAALLRESESASDIVLGSRMLRDADVARIPVARRLLLRVAVWFTRLTERLPVTDTHNGLRVFTADAARRMRLTERGMAHASEFLSETRRLGLRMREHPVSIAYTGYARAKGQSALGAVDIVVDSALRRMEGDAR